jgi:hypothetical protein
LKKRSRKIGKKSEGWIARDADGGSGVRGGSGWQWLVAVERGEQGGHFGGEFIRIGGILSEIWVFEKRLEKC